jgi:hypothetical protein
MCEETAAIPTALSLRAPSNRSARCTRKLKKGFFAPEEIRIPSPQIRSRKVYAAIHGSNDTWSLDIKGVDQNDV